MKVRTTTITGEKFTLILNDNDYDMTVIIQELGNNCKIDNMGNIAVNLNLTEFAQHIKATYCYDLK